MTVTDESRSEHGRYDRNFYLDQVEISRRSARSVVPMLIDALAPTSVVDLGCGIGTWLAVFEEWGVPDVMGVDGSGGASGLMQIDADRFLTRDLTRSVELGRRFDLA